MLKEVFFFLLSAWCNYTTEWQPNVRDTERGEERDWQSNNLSKISLLLQYHKLSACGSMKQTLQKYNIKGTS